MNKEEIKELIRKCDAYIEGMEKFRQALETIRDLTELSPEGLTEWKENVHATCPDADPMVDAMLNLVPGGNEG